MGTDTDCLLAPLPGEALLLVEGPDAATFLQGQTTCDLRKLHAGQGLVGAYCTPQGRVVCDFLLTQLAPERLALRMRRSILASAAASFGKYIIFSKAELDATGEAWSLFGCWGERAGEVLSALFPEIPRGQYASSVGEHHALVQLDADGHCFECYLHDDAGSLAQALVDAAAAATEDAWRARQIGTAIARIESDTVEEFIPQMLNYDVTGHISFDKGCYTGQEVIARLHYRGKSKRRLYRVSLDGDSAPPAGTPLFAAGEQSVGAIVESAGPTDGRVQALAVATATGVQEGLHLAAAGGPPVTVESLPYALGGD